MVFDIELNYDEALQLKGHIDNIRVSGDTRYSNDQSMAVRNDWPIFASILQKSLDSIPQQQHDLIYNRWMSIQFEKTTDYHYLSSQVQRNCQQNKMSVLLSNLASGLF